MAVTESEVQERDLSSMLSDIAALEALAEDWPMEQQNAAQARAEAVDSLNAAAFRRLIRSLQSAPGIGAALKSAAGDEVVYTVLRRHGILKPSLHEQVDAALDTIRPTLASHGGDVELVDVEATSVTVKFLGACDGCPASALTFYGGVKKAIQDRFPQITEIRQKKGLGGGSGVEYASPFADFQADDWAQVAALSSIDDGSTQVFDVEGESVLLSRLGDKVTCFANSCAHMGMPMDGGDISDAIITCPYHGFRYSLESGECLTAPEVQLQPHGVRVKDGQIEIRLTR